MLPITGYVDRWSARPGETIRFMISVRGGGRYRARVAWVICGDPNPAGPGYREVPVPWALEGEHEGEEQPIARGSWVDVPQLHLGAPGRPIAFAATVWPTRAAAGEQAVLAWHGQEASLELGVGGRGAYCRLTSQAGTWEVSAGVPLTERAWHDVACVLDPAGGKLHVGQVPRKPRLDLDERTQEGVGLPAGTVIGGPGRVAIAARRAGPATERHFNGKIERPRILAHMAGLDAVLRTQAAGGTADAGQVVAAWDFSVGIPTNTATDTGPAGAHGRVVNLPTRAMTGSTWRGDVHRWTEAPEQYGAIHFHDDDVGDAGWQPSLEFAVPGDWPSGVYALHLEKAGGKDDGARDNVVFYVRAAEPGRQARVAFLAPTFSYTVYGQFQRAGRQGQIMPRSLAWGALPHAPDGHPEYGVSPYNFHSDGSGVAMSSMRRPMIDKRVNQIHLMDPSPDGSGVYWVCADSYVTDLLDRRGIPFEVITDHDVHAEGVGLLGKYQVVLTGQHPEYHTTETLDALGAYLGQGGRLMYLGGNGFYWKVVPQAADDAGHHAGYPWAFEVRRAEGGIRLWETLPGEGYHAFDGSYGGLWRRLGRPPQGLVGVGFSTQGDYVGYPYLFLDGILDPRVAFMRHGLDAQARPGQPLGERGLMGGGAAGHELDRADPRLGTPVHAVVVGRAVLHDPRFQPVNEERFDHTWPAPREELIRSDLTFFETPDGGAVFSVGSMNFVGALPVDGYANVAAKLVENVVRRFADPTPFPPPGCPADT